MYVPTDPQELDDLLRATFPEQYEDEGSDGSEDGGEDDGEVAETPTRDAVRETRAGADQGVIPISEWAAQWTTERTSAIHHVEGWGLDGPTDLTEIRLTLARALATKQIEAEPEWAMSRIAPRVMPPEPDSYYAPSSTDLEHLPPLARRKYLEGVERRGQFLAHIARGHTVAQACEEVGMSRATYTKWRERFPDFANRVDRVRRGQPDSDFTYDKDSFTSRRAYFFGYETYTHHQQIVDAIDSTPPGGVTMILVAPEAGKTSLIEDYCCDRLAEDPSTRILYVSETADGHARKVLSTVKDRMTDPDYTDPNTNNPTHIPEWIATYGPFRDDALDKDKPWNQNWVKLHNASGRRDYSFQCAGWRSRVYGARCDLLIFDDVQSDESLMLTPQMVRRIRKTFLTRPGRHGKTIFIGTRIGDGDVYEALIKEGVVDRLVMLPAMDDHGRSYCPEMWPEDALEQKRRLVGEEVWWTAYMQAPQLATDPTFSDEMLDQAKNATIQVGYQPDDAKGASGLDPALGGGTAIVTIAYTYDRLWIVDVQESWNLARNEDIFVLIQSHAGPYRFQDLIVEVNALQRGIARDDRLKILGDTHGFRIREHETNVNKWTPDFGVGAMAGSFLRGEIVIPWADKATQARMTPLVNQLRAWRPGVPSKLLVQNLVMAMWFAWRFWQQQRKSMETDLSAWSTRGTPWRPGDLSSRWRSPSGVS